MRIVCKNYTPLYFSPSYNILNDNSTHNLKMNTQQTTNNHKKQIIKTTFI